jgi:hypothetical protein
MTATSGILKITNPRAVIKSWDITPLKGDSKELVKLKERTVWLTTKVWRNEFERRWMSHLV